MGVSETRGFLDIGILVLRQNPEDGSMKLV